MTKKEKLKTTGRIFDIQRFSVHDGPGIRTTVFLEGCPLRCAWCHNPEGISTGPLISFRPGQCIGCGRCFEVCPHEAHRIENGQHILDRERCESCGLCAHECHANALEQAGRETTVTKVLETVLRDRPFYETSGGGMTLSGGEPLFQSGFSESLLAQAKQTGLHCCVETSGYCNYTDLKKISPYVDLFLYDWKDSNPDRHVEYCGASNDIILKNLQTLHDAGKAILLRCPIIPGLNDREDHFKGIARLVNLLPNLMGVELIPYHRLGEAKMKAFGLEAQTFLPKDIPETETIQQWIEKMGQLGVTVIHKT